jgi:selenium metabolism protein YedF
MTTLIDARGLACPQPVIHTRQAMQQADQVVTLVDNEGSAANVTRMAEKAGWQVQVTPQGNDYRIELSRAGAKAQIEPQALGRAEFLGGPIVLAVSGDRMGRGEPELGRILIRSFFHTLGEVRPQPDRILLFNTAVMLACQESPVLDDLRALEEQGVEILTCGTCLGHFELKERLAVGRISNMYEIAESMLNAGKLVSL